MGEFFRGWKRKTGLVSLVMACVLTAGWIRSHATIDQISLRRPGRIDSHQLCSFRGGIVWARRTTHADFPSGVYRYSHAIDPIDTFFTYIPGMVFEWRWSRFGFEAGEFHDLEMPTWRMAWWTTPYYSLVTPLTLLSTWLLLSRPRSRLKSMPPPARGTIEENSSH